MTSVTRQHRGVKKDSDLAVVWLQQLFWAVRRGVCPGQPLGRDGAWTGPEAVSLP